MRNTRNHTGNRRERGAAAVETALLLPLLVLVLMAVIDFGRYMWVRDAVREAAAEGLRMAVLTEPTSADIETLIAEELNRSGLVMAHNVTMGTRSPGQFVEVAVNVSFEFVFMPGVLADLVSPQGITFSATGLCER